MTTRTRSRRTALNGGLPAATQSHPVRAHSPHHWFIDPANGPFSWGRCRHCGARRRFRNWLGDTAWAGADDPILPNQKPSAGRAALSDGTEIF